MIKSSTTQVAYAAYQRIGRMIGFALVAGSTEVWLRTKFVLRACLTDKERAALAFAALKSLDTEIASVVDAVIDRAGQPLPALSCVREEAASWADFTDPSEAIQAPAVRGWLMIEVVAWVKSRRVGARHD